MHVTVHFFSYAKYTGISDTLVELSPEAKLADLTHRLAELFPTLFPAANSATWLVNYRTATPETPLNDGDRIILLRIHDGP